MVVLAFGSLHYEWNLQCSIDLSQVPLERLRLTEKAKA